MSLTTPSPLRILIINPNTTTAMTDALHPAISTLNVPNITASFSYFTCPSTPPPPSDTTTTTTGGTSTTTPAGIPSINSPSDAAVSAAACIPHLLPLLPHHDAFLVACYSEHPLVPWLRSQLLLTTPTTTPSRKKHVTGIFEASVAASLSLSASRGPKAGFGIVSTGSVWEAALGTAVEGFVGGPARGRFWGCQTTGLNADELHRVEGRVVREKMKMATGRVVEEARGRGGIVAAVCLGCAGMVGLEVAVREALVEALGVEEGGRVFVVDGVKAGVGELLMLAGGGF